VAARQARSYIYSLSDAQRIFEFDAKVSNSAVDFGVTNGLDPLNWSELIANFWVHFWQQRECTDAEETI